MSTSAKTNIFVAVSQKHLEHSKSEKGSEVTRYDTITGKPFQVKIKNVSYNIGQLNFPDAENLLQIEEALNNEETPEGNDLSDGYLCFLQDDSPTFIKMSDYNYWGDYHGEFGIGYELFGQYANSHLEIDELDYNLIPNSILKLKQWFKENLNLDVSPTCYVVTSLG